MNITQCELIHLPRQQKYVRERGLSQANPNLFFPFFFLFFPLLLLFYLLIHLFSTPGKHCTKELHSNLLLKSITFHTILSPLYVPLLPDMEISYHDALASNSSI